jgi:hypothetical protein
MNRVGWNPMRDALVGATMVSGLQDRAENRRLAQAQEERAAAADLRSAQQHSLNLRSGEAALNEHRIRLNAFQTDREYLEAGREINGIVNQYLDHKTGQFRPGVLDALRASPRFNAVVQEFVANSDLTPEELAAANADPQILMGLVGKYDPALLDRVLGTQRAHERNQSLGGLAEKMVDADRAARPPALNQGLVPGSAVRGLGTTPAAFDVEGRDYDYQTAEAAGMERDANGRLGSVVPVSQQQREQLGLPEGSYMVLKGRGHETWNETVAGEEARGSVVVKKGDRYFSVPADVQAEEPPAPVVPPGHLAPHEGLMPGAARAQPSGVPLRDFGRERQLSAQERRLGRFERGLEQADPLEDSVVQQRRRDALAKQQAHVAGLKGAVAEAPAAGPQAEASREAPTPETVKEVAAPPTPESKGLVTGLQRLSASPTEVAADKVVQQAAALVRAGHMEFSDFMALRTMLKPPSGAPTNIKMQEMTDAQGNKYVAAIGVQKNANGQYETVQLSQPLPIGVSTAAGSRKSPAQLANEDITLGMSRIKYYEEIAERAVGKGENFERGRASFVAGLQRLEQFGERGMAHPTDIAEGLDMRRMVSSEVGGGFLGFFGGRYKTINDVPIAAWEDSLFALKAGYKTQADFLTGIAAPVQRVWQANKFVGDQADAVAGVALVMSELQRRGGASFEEAESIIHQTLASTPDALQLLASPAREEKGRGLSLFLRSSN